MILLLGESGYIGQAFASEMRQRRINYSSLNRKEYDYSRFDVLVHYLLKNKIKFVIGAAGYTGKPNVDACEANREKTIEGNILLPLTIAQACYMAGIPYGHVSSGCVFSGAGEKEHGFSETDPPNFAFDRSNCSFYSGTKALAEKAIGDVGEVYIWRLRMPFDEVDSPRNYLSKLLTYDKLLESTNSISHRMDFAKACLDLWSTKALFGVYNITNPGSVTTRCITGLISRYLYANKVFKFFENEEEFYKSGVIAPRSNCVLDTSKLINAGVSIRPVEEALIDSLQRWKSI